jgi:hypothetical protein
MADDELKKSSERTLSDDLWDVGEAALAVGAGAALLYRSGGAKYLSDGAERASRFLSHAHSEITARSLQDWNTRKIRSVAGGLKKAWREIGQDVESRNIGLRTEDHRSLFGMMGEVARLRSNPGAYLIEMYERDKLINPTLEHFDQNLATGEEAFTEKMHGFIRGLGTKISDDVSIESHMDSSHLADGEKDIARQAVAHMRSLNSAASRNSYKAEQEKIIKFAENLGSNLDNWEDHYGSETNPTSARNFTDSILGDKAATIGDILNHADKVQESRMFYKKGRDQTFYDTIRHMQDLRQELRDISEGHEQRFLALTPDAAVLRKDASGNVYSFKAASKITDKAMDWMAGTLPGKLLKLRDVEYGQKAPAFQYIGKGDYDPILAALANKNKGESQADSHFFRIMNKVYRTTEDGLEHVKEADNTHLVSGKFGTQAKLLRQIMGHVDHRRSDNILGRIFDIGQDGEIPKHELMISRIKKFGDPNWRGNVADRLLRPTEEQTHDLAMGLRGLLTDSRKYAVDYLGKARQFNSFLSKNSYELHTEAISKMLPHTSGEARNLLQKLMINDNDQLINEVLSREGSSIGRPDRYINRDLVSLISDYVANPKKAMDAITLKSDRTNFIPGSKETASFHDILRMELGKEALLQHAYANGGHESILGLVEKAGLKGKIANETKRLGHWASFQDVTGISARTDHTHATNVKRMWDTIEKVENLLDTGASDEFRKDMHKTFSKMASERISHFEDHAGRDTKMIGRARYGDWVHMQNAVTPLDVLKSLNDKTKLKATSSKFVKQFFAGRNDPHNITTATMYPYFFLARLSDEMNKVGLGLSKSSMQSVGQMTKNIALKRVLPVGIGMAYYDWMDDTTEQLTGTSISGSVVNGIGNADLAFRRLGDKTGLTSLLKDEKSINPIMQYYFGKDPYQNYDERKDYYENGYDPVRKGRYWTFGGVNEFRGGQIAYWEPNFVRRVNSNYKDKSLYDGYLDKWSHSWLPTPSNPLSPVMALMDPYWLEEKHKEDRPFPVSGKLFSEGTPWGVVLNPTIGEMIKPQKRLNTDRMEDGVDVKTLIYQMNKEVQAKALNESNQNLIILKGGQMEPMQFTAYNAPTMDERIYTMQFQGRRMQDATAADYGYYNGGVTPGTYVDSSDNGEMPMAVQGSQAAENIDLTAKEKPEISAATDNTLSAMEYSFIRQVDPIADIGHINRGIAMKAQYNKAQGVMNPEKMINVKMSYGTSLLNDAETVNELMQLSTGNDMIQEASFSARMISGIYGYGANRLVGFGANAQKRLATSADMDSPFRTFWDSGFGGGGGEVMEIARRFMPEFKRNTRVNPLMNTMPDWLPERFRFGDPYSQYVPKGEMRLPGKGYESLNELHPDQFGDYGAFDRFKVLADVASNSPEYKIWKNIAKKTVMDPKLKEEIKKISSRVAQQGKQHEFYDYQFTGRGVDYNKVTVTQILERGKFKVYGSDEIYKLAGVKLKGGADGTSTQDILGQHLHAGQEITMAIDENKAYQKNNDKDRSVSAAVFVDGENLSKKLIEEGKAEVRKGDASAAASVAQFTPFQQAKGRVLEALAHLDVPWLSDQYLRVRSPLESYRAEQVYGTPYQTWSDPIGTFLQPAMERAVSDHKTVMIGEVASYLQRISEHVPGISPTMRKAITGAYMLSNRGAFIGGTLGYLVRPESGAVIRRGARLGSMAMTLGHLYTGMNDPMETMLGFGHMGYEAAVLLKTSSTKSVAVGAAIGLALYGANNNVLSEKKEWIPERTKKKWQMQEYFDRLNYIKFTGLYHEAAEKALDEEDVDIEQLVVKQERDVEKKKALSKELMGAKQKLALLPENSEMRKHLEEMVNKKMQAVQESQVVLRAGRWTQAALLYKQAADSTMYGLKQEGSTWAQVIRALPKNDREYFMEFVKERDPEKRESILAVSSPSMTRALKQAWGEKQEEMESNNSYFQKHNLPGFSWSGWRPGVDLADVQLKTIANEGMLLSDFGFFESQLRDPDVINAPNLDPSGQQDPLTLQANLLATLRGLGLYGVDVSVQPAPTSGVQVVANVARIVENKLDSAVHDIFRLL